MAEIIQFNPANRTKDAMRETMRFIAQKYEQTVGEFHQTGYETKYMNIASNVSTLYGTADFQWLKEFVDSRLPRGDASAQTIQAIVNGVGNEIQLLAAIIALFGDFQDSQDLKPSDLHHLGLPKTVQSRIDDIFEIPLESRLPVVKADPMSRLAMLAVLANYASLENKIFSFSYDMVGYAKAVLTNIEYLLSED